MSFRVLVVLFFLIIGFVSSFSYTIYLSKTTVEIIGDVIFLRVESSNFTNMFVRTSFNTNILFPFYYLSGSSVSIIPIPFGVVSKNITIEILTNGKVMYVDTLKLKLPKEKPKKVVKLNLSSESRSIITNVERILRDREYIFKKISSINNYYFQGSFPKFSLPSTNRITSGFGIARSYSDGRVRYHNGIDFSALPDDNVYSVGDGIVIISGNFLANGQSIYIYHGYGIISSYFHLAEIFVKEGDFVRRGDIIGKIGGTGIVTAPHLHLGMYVWGIGGYVAVNPLNLIYLDVKNQDFISQLSNKKISDKF